MKPTRIYLSPPHVDQKEELVVIDALRNGWIAPVGPNIDDFENGLKTKFSYTNVLALNSGTAALHLAVKLCGITKGDKVLIGTMTFVAAANAVLYEGGIPVFIDSEKDTWNMDPDLLEQRLIKAENSGEFIKAVIVTHIYGTPAKIVEIKRLCEAYNVKLIEDAAEALGAMVEEKYVGGFGDYGILSFNGNKIITTSGGGALICKKEEDDKKARFWAQQSKDPANHYQHSEIGHNYRLSNILAAIGSSQLDKLEEFCIKKRKIHALYEQILSENTVFEFLKELPKSYSNRWLTTALISSQNQSLNPNDIIAALEIENIEARRIWKPLHLQPLFEGCEFVGNGVAEENFNLGVCLPSGVGLTEADQTRIIKVIKSLLSGRGFFE